MNCDKYQKLTPRERSHFIGELVHAVQNDDAMFEMAVELVNQANRRGLFDNVTIMPDVAPIDPIPPTHQY